MSFLNWLGALPGAAAQGLAWGIMAIGVYITFRILDLADLTVDGSFCTGAAVFTVMTVAHLPLPLAVLCAFLSGALAGALTGVFHTLLGIPAILSGILTQLILWSVNLKILGGANVSLPARQYDLPISMLKMGQSIAILAAAAALVILVLYWFFGTELGSSLRSTGCNEQMSRAQGINTNFTKILGLILSNGIVAFAGALLTQYQGFADVNMGRGSIVVGLAAVVIGEAIVTRISPNFAVRLIGVAIGAVVYWFVYQTVIFFGLDPDLLKMLSALIVAAFLAFPYLKQKHAVRGRKGA